MIIKTKKMEIELSYKTKKIVRLNKKMGKKSLEELYFSAMSENDIEALAEIIMEFAEGKDTGLQSFKEIDDVYDFIDDYMSENGKGYGDIYKEVAEDINEQGFFNQKMSKTELKKKISEHISIDINKIIEQSTEKAITSVMMESPLVRG